MFYGRIKIMQSVIRCHDKACFQNALARALYFLSGVPKVLGNGWLRRKKS